MLASSQNNRLCQESFVPESGAMENGPRLTPSAPRRNEEGGGTRAKSPRNAKHGWNPRATLTAGATSRRVASCRPTGYMGQLCTCTSLAPSAISSLVHLRLVHPPLVNVHLQARNLRLSITSSCTSSVREGVVSSGSLLRFTNLSLFRNLRLGYSSLSKFYGDLICN